ncbi:hypothetical protein [Streptomyces sp. NPDC050546]|uniref:hypothetical protein n=1 Tax=Streptomyces sp. NPDC050546 TaxID=3365628 RepID=UPI0037BBA611
MDRSTYGFDSEDQEHDEFMESDNTRGWGAGRKERNKRDTAAWCLWLREQVAEDIKRQSATLTTRTEARTEALQRSVDSLGKRLDAVARNVDLLLDALRDQGVRDAIDAGRATSDVHRRHLELAQTYRTLVTQALRDLGRLLCPKVGDEGRTELARRRAQAVAHLVALLFQPLDQPMSSTQEEIVDRLRAFGLATEGTQVRGQFAAVFRRAAELREGVAGLALSAELDFAVDLTALPADHYQPWEEQQADDAQPEFLIAPAYVVGGDRPQSLSRPIVFVTSTGRP